MKRPSDPNTRESTDDALSADLEGAWQQWSASVQKVDERVRSLLRAAFEAGANAATTLAASSFGRRAGLKGGVARAKKLSKAKRSAIAKRAAAARWGNGKS